MLLRDDHGFEDARVEFFGLPLACRE